MLPAAGRVRARARVRRRPAPAQGGHPCRLSGDEALCDLLRSAGARGDPFLLLAARWRVDRAWAKSICYGLCYGKGVAQLAVDLGCDAAAAAAAVREFDALFPALARWRGGGVQRDCAAREPAPHVLTIAGRRRYLPDARAARAARAGRQAVNTVCQVCSGEGRGFFRASPLKADARRGAGVRRRRGEGGHAGAHGGGRRALGAARAAARQGARGGVVGGHGRRVEKEILLNLGGVYATCTPCASKEP